MLRSTVRAVLSLLPPGADPTTISTFFCGDHVCAAAMVPAHAVTRPNITVTAFKPYSSLLGHVRGLDHSRILVDLGAYESGECLGRTADRVDTFVQEALFEVGAREDTVNLDVEARDDVLRGAGRRHEAEPRGCLVPLEAGFIERRDLGDRREALQAADGDRAQAA